jgi:hypothetical protein
MMDDPIDFISAYCDRWCERCAFTTRCSAFRVTTAIAMCGDVDDGLELALGTPGLPEPYPAEQTAPLFDFDWQEPTPEELARFRREEEARRTRLHETSLMVLAEGIRDISWEWLTAHENLLPTADLVLKDALEIVAHDTALISTKIYRALHGRDEREHDEDDDQHEVQNDWNGSAKVALISVRRSAVAWLTVADATGDTMAAHLARELEHLRGAIEESFLLASAFIRPGFDEAIHE